MFSTSSEVCPYQFIKVLSVCKKYKHLFESFKTPHKNFVEVLCLEDYEHLWNLLDNRIENLCISSVLENKEFALKFKSFEDVVITVKKLTGSPHRDYIFPFVVNVATKFPQAISLMPHKDSVSYLPNVVSRIATFPTLSTNQKQVIRSTSIKDLEFDFGEWKSPIVYKHQNIGCLTGKSRKHQSIFIEAYINFQVGDYLYFAEYVHGWSKDSWNYLNYSCKITEIPTYWIIISIYEEDQSVTEAKKGVDYSVVFKPINGEACDIQAILSAINKEYFLRVRQVVPSISTLSADKAN